MLLLLFVVDDAKFDVVDFLLLILIKEEQVFEEETLVSAFGLFIILIEFEPLPPYVVVGSGLRPVAAFENLLSMSKISFCHCISQKATLASFESSHKLMFSSFGDSVPQSTPEPGTPEGQADCHRSANVDIGGGRIGLLSSMRSSSSITLDDSRGKSCKHNIGF